jgi:hypothetical protein
MNTFIRNVVFIGIMLMTACSQGHHDSRQYTLKEVGWTITLPPDFKVADSAKTADQMQQGKKAIEESTNTKVDMSTTKTLINATKGHNTFNVTITGFDPKTDGDFAATNQITKNMVYQTFANQMPDAKVDSNSSSTTIGGLDFDQFHVNVKVKGQTIFNMYVLTKLYKGYDFGITYLYVDEASKREIEGILDNSQFQ